MKGVCWKKRVLVVSAKGCLKRMDQLHTVKIRRRLKNRVEKKDKRRTDMLKVKNKRRKT